MQQQETSPKDLLQCSICLEGYNLTDHKPRIFPACGHTVGEKCLQKFLKTSKNPDQCPNCKISFDAPSNFSFFCVNYQIMGIIAESLRWERCSILNHKDEELKLICLDCKKKLCVYCVIYDHKDHQIKSLEDLKPQVASKIDMLERNLQKLKTCSAQMGSKLKEAQSQSLNQTKSMLLRLTTLMNAKTTELFHQLDSLYEYQQTRIDEKVGQECPLRSSITEKILCYKSLTSHPDPLDLISQDISEYESKINESLSHTTLENLSQGLEKLPLLINKELESFLKTLGEINFSIDQLSRNIENDQELKKEISLSDLVVAVDFGINLKQEGDKQYLELKLDNKGRKPQILTPQVLDALKKTPELRIVYYESEDLICDDDMHTLCYIISKMENIKELSIKAQRVKLVGDEFKKLLSHAFFNVQNCVTVNLCLKKSIISLEVLSSFADECLPRIPHLLHLNIDFEGAKVSEKALTPLINRLGSIKDHIETLKINLNDTKMSEKRIIDFFIQAPKLKELDVSLKGIKLTKEGLENFVKNTISSASELKILRMGLKSTRVTDGGALALFNKIPLKLEEIFLDFENTKISDASVGSLTLQILPNLKSLKKGEIVTDNTRISEEADENLMQALDDILRINNYDNDEFEIRSD